MGDKVTNLSYANDTILSYWAAARMSCKSCSFICTNGQVQANCLDLVITTYKNHGIPMETKIQIGENSLWPVGWHSTLYIWKIFFLVVLLIDSSWHYYCDPQVSSYTNCGLFECANHFSHALLSMASSSAPMISSFMQFLSGTCYILAHVQMLRYLLTYLLTSPTTFVHCVFLIDIVY